MALLVIGKEFGKVSFGKKKKKASIFKEETQPVVSLSRVQGVAEETGMF